MMAATITNHINAIIASVLLSSPERSVPPPPTLVPNTLKGVDGLIHTGFEAYRATCFNWLLAATALVIVGLVLEGPELWLEITAIVQHWRFTRNFHFSFPEEHAPDWVKLIAFVGWLFIVVGVAGEYVADSFVSKADGYVQTFDEILLNEAQRNTSFARERASAAYERAAQTEKEAADDLKATNIARQKAEEARQKAEGFQLQVAQANERAANAERETAKLTNRFSDRVLTYEQIATMFPKLHAFSGQEFIITAYWEIREPKTLAERIFTLLTTAGWKHTPLPGGGVMLLGGMSGIVASIDPKSDPQTKGAAEALVSGLNADGIEAQVREEEFSGNPAHNKILITIGTKP